MCEYIVLIRYYIIQMPPTGSAYAPDNTSTIMPLASAQIQSGHFDMILHVGDLAYDLQDG